MTIQPMSTPQEQVSAPPSERSRHFIRYVAVVLILGFVTFSLLAYAIGYSTMFDGLRAELRFFLKDISFAIGTACLVSLIFGFLLELPATSDFFANKLSDLMFGDAYLRQISSSLPWIRRRIDRVLFGEAELASQHSLYNFMERRLDGLYRRSFRRNMSVEIRCLEQPQNLLLWKQRTSYTYVRNRMDTSVAYVASKRSLDVAQSWFPEKGEEVAAFNRIVTRFMLRVGVCEFESALDDHSRLVRRDAGGYNADGSAARMPKEIQINYEFQLGKLSFDMKCELPLEMLLESSELFVEILDEHYTLREPGNLVYSAVAAPTENFTFDCFFPDGTRLEAARFYWHGPQRMAELGTEFGAISVRIPGWLLEGEGGSVMWLLPASSVAVIEPPAITDATET